MISDLSDSVSRTLKVASVRLIVVFDDGFPKPLVFLISDRALLVSLVQIHQLLACAPGCLVCNSRIGTTCAPREKQGRRDHHRVQGDAAAHFVKASFGAESKCGDQSVAAVQIMVKIGDKFHVFCGSKRCED